MKNRKHHCPVVLTRQDALKTSKSTKMSYSFVVNTLRTEKGIHEWWVTPADSLESGLRIILFSDCDRRFMKVLSSDKVSVECVRRIVLDGIQLNPTLIGATAGNFLHEKSVAILIFGKQFKSKKYIGHKGESVLQRLQ